MNSKFDSKITAIFLLLLASILIVNYIAAGSYFWKYEFGVIIGIGIIVLPVFMSYYLGFLLQRHTQDFPKTVSYSIGVGVVAGISGFVGALLGGLSAFGFHGDVVNFFVVKIPWGISTFLIVVILAIISASLSKFSTLVRK